MTQSTTSAKPATQSVVSLVASVLSYDGPAEQFGQFLMDQQCLAPGVVSGAILRFTKDQPLTVLALSPSPTPGSDRPVWINHAGEALTLEPLTIPRSVPLRRSNDPMSVGPAFYLVLIPISDPRSPQDGQVVAGYLIDAQSGVTTERLRDRLELTAALLAIHSQKTGQSQRERDMILLKQAMDVLTAVGGQSRFRAAAMALCNHIATVFHADRVSIGFLVGQYVKLKGLSNAEKFTRKMKLVQDIESAMEECLDQDVEVLYPPPVGATYISRTAEDLSRQHRTINIVSLPLRHEGVPVAVVTVERGSERPFNAPELTSLRLACELCSPHLISLHKHDRWIGAKLVSTTKEASAALVGPRHTWAKITALTVCLAVLLLVVIKGTEKVESNFTLRATQERAVPAPFDGYLLKSEVEPGTPVVGGKTVLAILDTSELALRLASSQAERLGYIKQADLAMRDGKTAEAQVNRAQADKLQALADLYQYQIDQARLVAPIDGVVLTGDYTHKPGTPVQTGQLLFEVGPLAGQWAELQIPEERIKDVRVGQTGTLACTAKPGTYLRFEVTRLDPVAEVVEQRNVFRARANIQGQPDWLKPGMQGVAKVEVGRASYAWLWTRQLVNWVRMKLWI